MPATLRIAVERSPFVYPADSFSSFGHPLARSNFLYQERRDLSAYVYMYVLKRALHSLSVTGSSRTRYKRQLRFLLTFDFPVINQ